MLKNCGRGTPVRGDLRNQLQVVKNVFIDLRELEDNKEFLQLKLITTQATALTS